jgi:Flp pilus assembly CpaF family ATPase
LGHWPSEQLIQESVVTVPRALIAETINVIAVLVRDGTGRRLSELAQVTGLNEHGDYQILPIIPQPQGHCL